MMCWRVLPIVLLGVSFARSDSLPSATEVVSRFASAPTVTLSHVEELGVNSESAVYADAEVLEGLGLGTGIFKGVLYKAKGCQGGIAISSIGTTATDVDITKLATGFIEPATFTAFTDLVVGQAADGVTIYLVTTLSECTTECIPDESGAGCDIEALTLGFQVYDVTDIAKPTLLSHTKVNPVNKQQKVWLEELQTATPAKGLEVQHITLFTQAGTDYLAVVSDWEDNVGPILQALQIFSLADPASPQLIGWWGPDGYIYAMGNDVWSQLTMSNSYDLFQGLETYGQAVRDLLGDLDGLGMRLSNLWVAEDGTWGVASTETLGLMQLDLSDLANPKVVAYSATNEERRHRGNAVSSKVWGSDDGKLAVEISADRLEFVPKLIIADDGVSTFAGSYGVLEMASFPVLETLGDKGAVGPPVYLGDGCGTVREASDLNLASGTAAIAALARTAACDLETQLSNTHTSGWDLTIIINRHPLGEKDVLFPRGGLLYTPAIFVSEALGLGIFGAADWANLDAGAAAGDVIFGTSVTVRNVMQWYTWGSVNIWQLPGPPGKSSTRTLQLQSSEASARHVAEFRTRCGVFDLSLTTQEYAGECRVPVPVGNYQLLTADRTSYTPTDVRVVKVQDHDIAIVAYAVDGVIVLNLRDPSAPEEVGRWTTTTPELLAGNENAVQNIKSVHYDAGTPETLIIATDNSNIFYALNVDALQLNPDSTDSSTVALNPHSTTLSAAGIAMLSAAVVILLLAMCACLLKRRRAGRATLFDDTINGHARGRDDSDGGFELGAYSSSSYNNNNNGTNNGYHDRDGDDNEGSEDDGVKGKRTGTTGRMRDELDDDDDGGGGSNDNGKGKRGDTDLIAL